MVKLVTAETMVPCTCGELVQGTLDGVPFLVSCPIDRYSRVRVTLALSQGKAHCKAERGAKHLLVVEEGSERCFAIAQDGSVGAREDTYQDKKDRAPGSNGKSGRASTTKAHKAAASTLKCLELESTPFHLDIACPLPPSKGFGTSTADVVGAISAVAEAAGRALSPAEIARLAVAVEPSDGTMFPGLAVFDHRGCHRWEELGQAPPLLVAALDFEGTVDTEDYNARIDTSRLHVLEREHARALELLKEGLRYHRLELVGEAATASARANQRLLPKPQLETAIALGRDSQALGVCAAHSGTALGVLFAPGEMAQATLFLDRARTRLDELSCSWIAKMVDGGARVPVTSARKQE